MVPLHNRHHFSQAKLSTGAGCLLQRCSREGLRADAQYRRLAGYYVLTVMTDSLRCVHAVVTNALSCSSLNSKRYLYNNYLIILVVQIGT